MKAWQILLAILLITIPASALSLDTLRPSRNQWDYPYHYQSSGYWEWHPYTYSYYQPYSNYYRSSYQYYRPYYPLPAYYYHPWRWSDRRYYW